jgi:SAM-dependent methyltransferase
MPRTGKPPASYLAPLPTCPWRRSKTGSSCGGQSRYVIEEADVDQFLDIGPGLPTQGNVHQIARQYAPQARVVYADNDPVVVAYGRALVEDMSNVRFVKGDLRAPAAILEQPLLRELIDLTRPVALCLTLVVHFITDEENPCALVAELKDALCPGSYLILSHVTGDERDPRMIRLLLVEIFSSAWGSFELADEPGKVVWALCQS